MSDEQFCECGHRKSYHKASGCIGTFAIGTFEGFRPCECKEFTLTSWPVHPEATE